jgi:hypothetical protein
VVTTSEYSAMRERVISAGAGRKADPTRPTLRRAPGSQPDAPDSETGHPTVKRKELADQ